MTDSILDYAPADSRAEWRLLMHCVATQCVDGGGVAPLALDAAGLNWAKIIQLAEAHCVVPLLAAAVIADRVRNVAPDVVADLKGRFRDSGQRGLSFVIELRSVLACLKSAQIRCIPLKGAVLMLGSYGKIGLRHFDDLDILVAPADVPGTVAALAKLGYAGWDIPDYWLAAHINTESEQQLACKERGFIVDVHWGVGRKYFTLPIEFDELWRRTVRTKLIGSPVPDLSPEDDVIYLCYHGGRHLFGRVSWLCDIAATVAAHPELDWDALMARATLMGARRLTLLGLFLARKVLRCELPDSVKRSIEDDSGLGALAATIARGMMRNKSTASSLREQIEASLFHLRVRERMSDRMRYLFWAAAPNMRDWGDTRLPRSLSFLFVLSRPIRLVRKHLAPAR